MNTIHRTLAIGFTVLFIALVSSCGTSNFKGYYPENRITGKGIGRQASPTVVTTDNTSETQELNTVTETPVETVMVNEPTVEPQELVDGKTASEILSENKFISKYMPAFISYTNVAQVNDFETQIKNIPWHQRLQARLFSRVYKKRIEKLGASAMSTGDIFAIVSLGAGGLAWISFYGFFLLSIGAIVMGILALKRNTNRRGMAIAGIALGATAFVLWLLFFGFVIGTGWF